MVSVLLVQICNTWVFVTVFFLILHLLIYYFYFCFIISMNFFAVVILLTEDIDSVLLFMDAKLKLPCRMRNKFVFLLWNFRIRTYVF